MGYAGDYGIVNMILEDPHQGESPAKFSFVGFVKQPPGEAHRNRVHYLTARLAGRILARRPFRRKNDARFQCRRRPRPQTRDFMAAHEISNTGDFVLVDFNEETLAHGNKKS